MNARDLRGFLLGLAMLVAATASAISFPIESGGQKWAEMLDAMDVEHHWRAGEPIHWRKGEYNPDTSQEASHCSTFAAAACERAGVYLLRPPEHKQAFLANAQQEWLETVGLQQGWSRVASPEEAQHLANQGWVVVASLSSANPHRPGHIAMVRPSQKSREEIQRDGPQIIQAGQHNYSSTSVREGNGSENAAVRA